MCFADFPKTKKDLLEGSHKSKSRFIQKSSDTRITWMFASYKFREIQRKTPLLAVGVSFLGDCNWTRTHNHLVRKQELNHLTKLAKWLSCVVSTYLYGAFDCMFLSCHVRISGWIHTLQLPACQGTPFLKQVWNFVPASSKEFFDIQATTECSFTLKRVHGMTKTYSLFFLIRLHASTCLHRG